MCLRYNCPVINTTDNTAKTASLHDRHPHATQCKYMG